jgi:hypothetical protein
MDQAATEAAVSISPVDPADPAVANIQVAWGSGELGDLMTISYDPLEYETWYEVVVSTAALGTNGLNKLAADTFTFKTLPQPPEVVSTFPENLAEEVPIDSPISIEFSKSMVPDSVEKVISFNPELGGLSFVWNPDNTTVYISSDEMVPSTMYFLEVGAEASDEFGTQMPEPYIFAFTTSIATSVEDNMAADVTLYPNPATDILQIRGMEVASVKIYSLTGQLLNEIRNANSIDVSDLDTGIYVFSVADRENNKIRRMIVVE